MIAEAKNAHRLEGEPRLSLEAQPTPDVFRQEELLILTSFFELLALWEARDKTHVS